MVLLVFGVLVDCGIWDVSGDCVVIIVSFSLENDNKSVQPIEKY